MKKYCWLIWGMLVACRSEENPSDTLFHLLPDSQTHVSFVNTLTETEDLNVLTYEYFYNGGGVAAGDLNNDGLTDLYFVGNTTPNQLYLNKGQLQFEDITQKAGVMGRKESWKTGVSLVDINADGWLDIYVCYSGNYASEKRKNQLFVNNHDLTFTEKAEAYGLADDGYTTQAAFFDYDLDGDLDCFVLNHNLRGYQRQEAHIMRTTRDAYAGDRLYQNDNGHFTDVTEQAGIKGNPLGFGLGVVVADMNRDNKPDLYVGNDYVEDDYLYINQGNGTFKDVLRDQLGHTSRFTMGVDIADINNDWQPDILTLDMLPEDNIRQKLLAFPDNWNNYQSMLANGFHHQNMRNMLHLNNGNGTFSEIGQVAGISNTDWSWSALLADLDNDGWKDLFVTNGVSKDFTNSDFIKYTADEEMKAATGQPHASLVDQIKKMPSARTHLYAFRNNGDLTFTDKSTEWGFANPTVANGAVYADLDNDGDLDLVTNANNAKAQIYQNTSQEKKSGNYLNVKFKGPAKNPFGVHAKVFVTNGDQQQLLEFSPERGFQSSVYEALHVGLGKDSIGTIVVAWPDGKTQFIGPVKANQTVVAEYAKLLQAPQDEPFADKPAPVFIESKQAVLFSHKENPTNDFNRQLLLPYQYSYSGARMAKGDINGDGLEDLYLPGARNQAAQLAVQQKDNTFQLRSLPAFQADLVCEDKDAVFFDADGDKDLDVYVVSGDFALEKNSPFLHDRLYLNDGKGTFQKATNALPAETLNGSCVKPLDIDHDGDLDLFVGGTVVPNAFPLAEPSLVLRNNGKGQFEQLPEGQLQLGLVSDAVVMPAGKNGSPELVVVGEWMAPKVVSFANGKPEIRDLVTTDAQQKTRLLNGWWNRIAATDFDNDGDPDLVLGNLGQNCQMRCTPDEPMRIFSADFDQNGTLDPVLSYYIQHRQYPAVSRDELLEQIVPLRQKYTDYQSFAQATLDDVLTKDDQQRSTILRIDYTETCMLENTPQGFVLHALPIQAQYAPVYAIALEDVNEDGKKDIVLAGNQSYYHLRIGKMDANYGFLFLNEGNFRFTYVPQPESGLKITGDVKDIQKVSPRTWVFFRNNDAVKVYQGGRTKLQ